MLEKRFITHIEKRFRVRFFDFRETIRRSYITRFEHNVYKDVYFFRSTEYYFSNSRRYCDANDVKDFVLNYFGREINVSITFADGWKDETLY
jgi:hypothetical protein